MKIVHLLSGLATGGAERMLVKLIKDTKSNIKHVVISLSDKGEQGQYIEEMNVPVITMGMSKAIQSIFYLNKLKKLILNQKPDLVQAWMYNGNLAAILACRKLNIPVVYNVRHSLHDIKSEKKIMQFTIYLNAYFSKKANAIIYNSSVSQTQHEDLGFSSKSSIMIPNGFDINIYNRSNANRFMIREEFKIPQNAFLFVQVGRNHPMKNHKGFVEAAIRTIQMTKRNDIYFLIVGKDVDNDLELQNLIQTSNNKKQILLSKQRSDIEKIWSAADCGVLSSLWGEGFPNVVGEAMACENPCIVTDIGDSAFIVNDYGVVIPSDNVGKMSNAMINMFQMPKDKALIMQQQARKRIVNEFSIKQVSAQYLSLYRSIIKNK